jgi:hypothetical protein
MVRTTPKKSPGYSFSLQPCQVMFLDLPRDVIAVLPVLDCVSTHFALRPQHGTPPPSLPVICVKLMICPGWTACYFPLHKPPYNVSSQEIWVLIPRGKSTGCFLLFCTRTTTLYFFYMNYEQTSSRTLWLKAFSCKPCMRFLGWACYVNIDHAAWCVLQVLWPTLTKNHASSAMPV